MTAENNGTGPGPEGDDPFAHLYRQEGGDGAAAAQRQPGVPRRSYSQVRTVGERQYGGYAAGGGPAQAAPAQAGADGGAGYGPSPSSAHYAAPETVPGGRAAARQGHAGDAGGSRSGGRGGNGLLIGAIAVVAAVVVGIGTAIAFNSDDSGDTGSTPSSGDSAGGDQADGGDAGQDAHQDEKQQAKQQDLPKRDAATLRLDGGTTTDNQVKGAKGKGGLYVAGLNKVGAKATWSFTMPEAGEYKLSVRYGIPGENANATLVVNGKPNTQPLGMDNFINSPKGDWEKGWQTTWAPVTLKKGANTIEIACAEGNKCNANLDQVWIETKS